jgi:MFS family permease
VFGTLLNGILVDRYGQKRVLIGALCSLSCFIFMTVFAPNIGVLAVGQFLCVSNPCPNYVLSFVSLLFGMKVLLTLDAGLPLGNFRNASASICFRSPAPPIEILSIKLYCRCPCLDPDKVIRPLPNTH